jgi:hypothetical protein
MANEKRLGGAAGAVAVKSIVAMRVKTSVILRIAVPSSRDMGFSTPNGRSLPFA